MNEVKIAELPRVLRICRDGSCKDCPRNGTMDCDINLYSDAADAIETLLFEIDQWKQAWRTCYELRKEELKNEQEVDD